MSSNKKETRKYGGGKKRPRIVFQTDDERKVVRMTPTDKGVTLDDVFYNRASSLQHPIPIFTDLPTYTPDIAKLHLPTFAANVTRSPEVRKVNKGMMKRSMSEVTLPRQLKGARNPVKKFVKMRLSDRALRNPGSYQLAKDLDKRFSENLSSDAAAYFKKKIDEYEKLLKEEQGQAQPNKELIEMLKFYKKSFEDMKKMAEQKDIHDTILFNLRMKPRLPSGELTREMFFRELAKPTHKERRMLRQALDTYEKNLEALPFYQDLVRTLFDMLPDKYGKDVFNKSIDVTNGYIFPQPNADVEIASTETQLGTLKSHPILKAVWRQVLNVNEATAIKDGLDTLTWHPIIAIFNFFTLNSKYIPQNKFFVHDFNSFRLSPSILANNDVIISLATLNVTAEEMEQNLDGTHTIALVWVKTPFLQKRFTVKLDPITTAEYPSYSEDGWWCFIYDSSGWTNPVIFQYMLEHATIDDVERSLYVADQIMSEKAHFNYMAFKNNGGINGIITRESYGELQQRHSVCVFYSLYVAWHFITSPPTKLIDIDINVNPDRIAHLFAPFVFRLLRQYRDMVPGIVSFPDEYQGDGIFSS